MDLLVIMLPTGGPGHTGHRVRGVQRRARCVQNDSRPCRRHMALTPAPSAAPNWDAVSRACSLAGSSAWPTPPPSRAVSCEACSPGKPAILRCRDRSLVFFGYGDHAALGVVYAGWCWLGIVGVVSHTNGDLQPRSGLPAGALPVREAPVHWRTTAEWGVGAKHCLLPRRTTTISTPATVRSAAARGAEAAMPSAPAAYVRQYEGRSRDEIRERRANRQRCASSCGRLCGAMTGHISCPAMPRLRGSSMCLLAPRSGAACKHTSLSLHCPTPSGPTRALLTLKAMAVALVAIFGAPVQSEGVRVSTALRPKRLGAPEGVDAGLRPAPVEIGDSRRRGPFSGL